MEIDIVFACPEISSSKIINRPHLGISYLRSYLEHEGISTYYVRHLYPLSIHEYVKHLLNIKTNIYGFSVTDDTMELFIALSKELKHLKNNCKVIVGGAIAKPESASYLLKNSFCDAVVIGEGEIPCAELVQTILSGQELTYKNIIPGVALWDHTSQQVVYKNNPCKIDINSYPSPILRDLIPEADLTESGIFSSRGCFHHCIYCSFSAISEQRVQFYEESRFLSEVEKISYATRKHHPKEQIPIWDDAFTLAAPRAKRLLKEIIQMNTGVSFWLQTRVDRIDEELVSLMKEAGIDHVGLGLESASPKVLKAIRKIRVRDFDLPGTEIEEAYLNKFIEFAKWARKYQLQFTINSIIGLPSETFEDALDTIRFVQQLRPKFYFHNILRLYTGVPLTRKYTEHGYEIIAPNLIGTPFEFPVNAKIMSYNYDISKVPSLPYRLNPKEITLIDGVFGLESSTPSTVILESAPNLTSQYLNSNFFYKKEVLYQKPILKVDDHSLFYSLSSLPDYTIESLERDILLITDVEMAKIIDYYNSLIESYSQDEYTRYAILSEKILSISINTTEDYNWISGLTTILDGGGEFELPNHISSFQFKKIMLKDACKWHNECPANQGKRYFVSNEGSIKSCEQGEVFFNLSENKDFDTNIYSSIIENVERDRKCMDCPVQSECSKCTAIPADLVLKYCELQRRKIRPLHAIYLIDYVISQIIDPLNLKVFRSYNNRIISPSNSNDQSLVFLICISNEWYYILKKQEQFRLFKIPTVLSESIALLWKKESPELFEKELLRINKYSLNEVEQIIEKVYYLERMRE